MCESINHKRRVVIYRFLISWINAPPMKRIFSRLYALSIKPQNWTSIRTRNGKVRTPLFYPLARSSLAYIRRMRVTSSVGMKMHARTQQVCVSTLKSFIRLFREWRRSSRCREGGERTPRGKIDINIYTVLFATLLVL